MNRPASPLELPPEESAGTLLATIDKLWGGEAVAPSFELERKFYSQGFSLVAGIDEAGRGPLAGPVVAGAVIFPASLFSSTHHNGQSDHSWLSVVDDSKVLTHRQRLEALEHIREHALSLGVGMATAQEIDSYGIVPATKKAMQRALESLDVSPSYLLIDHVQLTTPGLPYFSLPRGDSVSYSIAAASIVAKVTRDRIMAEADAVYPGYGFASHKGYATAEHRRRLSQLGPCPIHRRTFAPVRLIPDGAPSGAHTQD